MHMFDGIGFKNGKENNEDVKTRNLLWMKQKILGSVSWLFVENHQTRMSYALSQREWISANQSLLFKGTKGQERAPKS